MKICDQGHTLQFLRPELAELKKTGKQKARRLRLPGKSTKLLIDQQGWVDRVR